MTRQSKVYRGGRKAAPGEKVAEIKNSRSRNLSHKLLFKSGEPFARPGTDVADAAAIPGRMPDIRSDRKSKGKPCRASGDDGNIGG